MKATITMELDIPEDFEGMGPWDKAVTLESYISHWLFEGYYAGDHWPELPAGIEVKTFDIDPPQEWGEDQKAKL